MEPNPGSSLQWSGSVNTRCFVLLAIVTRSGAKRHKHGSGILELATWVGDERWLLEFVPGFQKAIGESLYPRFVLWLTLHIKLSKVSE